MPIKKIFGSLALVLSLSLPGSVSPAAVQQLQHEAVTVNIEIPVRVFSGDTFVDDLTIDDFEIYDDGVLQRVEAFYLVQETHIAREESGLPQDAARKTFSPQVARHFVLVFEVIDYLPELSQAVEYFFRTVYLEGDSLTVITPKRTYTFREDALNRLSREDVIRQLDAKLRADIVIANAEYKTLLKDIEDMYTQTGIFYWDTGDWKKVILELLEQVDQLRHVNEKRLVEFSDFLRSKDGQKNVFMFYQAEMLPKYDPFAEDMYTSGVSVAEPVEDPTVVFKYMDLGSLYHREISFDVDRIKQVFSDSSIQIHFLFVTKDPMQQLNVERMQSLTQHHIRYEEQSEDIFSAFTEVAEATGGFTASSYDAGAVFQDAVAAMNNYYLLYYSPNNYKEDGRFHSLEVKVKRGAYRVMHRAGYLAD
jgi:VWFA-related protein